MVLPDFLAQGKAVQIGEHDVQNGQIQMFPLHTGQSLPGGAALVNGVALIFQIDLHQIGNGRLVIHNQKFRAHRSRPPVL